MAVRRLYKEWQSCVEHPVEGISFGPFADSVFHWDAIIEGPAGTPYEGGTFMLDVVFPMDYPFKPPKVRFKTRIYHPNISKTGLLNLDILREKWSPALTISKVLICVRLLLVDDINPDDPLEPDIARLYKTDRAKYEETVREWTRKYAITLSVAVFHWEAIIEGPAGTPYEGGTFMVNVVFPMDYPFKPPKVQFKTRTYHPNISKTGLLNLDILKDAWSPALTISKVFICVRLLLVDDINPDDPLEPDIARLYKTDRAKYEETVREWTRKHAM